MSSDSASPSPVKQLLPFTGYYTLDSGVGNFLLIDTNLIYMLQDDGPSFVLTATVTLHGDEQPSAVFDFDTCCTFENDNLTVTLQGAKIVDVRLYKDYSNGNSSALEGTIGATKVKGVTPFSPIQLPVFAAKYYDLGGETDQPRLIIDPDYSLWYRQGSDEPVQIKTYGYNYAMFVIQFMLNGNLLAFEMGTAHGYGRVAGNAAKGGLLVSVPSFTSYPPPPPTTTPPTTAATTTTTTTTTTTVTTTTTA